MCALAEDDLAAAEEQLRQAAEMSDDPRDQASILPLLADVAERRGVTAYNDAVADLARGDPASSIGKLDRALTLSREAKAAELEQTVTFRLGVARSRTGDKQGAIAAFSEAADIAHRLGDESRRWLAVSNLGAKYTEAGQSQKAIEVLEPAERWLRQNDPGELVYALDGLGAAHFTLEQYDESLTYDTEALALFGQAGEDVRAANSAERVGLAYLCLGRYAEAKDALLDAAGRPHIANNPERLAVMLRAADGAARMLGDGEGDQSALAVGTAEADRELDAGDAARS
jgi:tetratricopeptide (TPR) repeat protein